MHDPFFSRGHNEYLTRQISRELNRFPLDSFCLFLPFQRSKLAVVKENTVRERWCVCVCARACLPVSTHAKMPVCVITRILSDSALYSIEKMTDPIQCHGGQFVFLPVFLYEVSCQYSNRRSSSARCAACQADSPQNTPVHHHHVISLCWNDAASVGFHSFTFSEKL